MKKFNQVYGLQFGNFSQGVQVEYRGYARLRSLSFFLVRPTDVYRSLKIQKQGKNTKVDRLQVTCAELFGRRSLTVLKGAAKEKENHDL